MSGVREVVLAAYAAGLCPLPPAEDGSKEPICAGARWKNYQSTRPTPQQIDAWWGPRTGVGYVTGKVSGNLEMLEFEEAQLFEMYRNVLEGLGLDHILERIAAGYSVATPGGGVHLAYFCDEIGKNTKLAKRPTTPEERKDPDDKYRVLIETRGEGGYTVEAPSNGKVHPTGGQYRQLRGSVSTIATITPEERVELFRIARSFDLTPVEEARPQGEPAAGSAEGKPGTDFRAKHGTLDAFRTIVEPHGWKLAFTRGSVGYFRRPGKDKGISATFGHGGYDYFYVFSTSTVFESERGYNPFSVYAILNHDGKFDDAARQLGKDGYGEQPATLTIGGKTIEEWAAIIRERARADSQSQGTENSTPGTGDPVGDTETSCGSKTLCLSDFASYLPERKYIYLPTGKVWEPAGLNRAFPPIGSGKDAIKQSDVVDELTPVHDLTWAPGKPQIIEDAFLDHGGWIAQPGARAYNAYRPPRVTNGDPDKAGRWIEHVQSVYPDHADHIIDWLAHRVSRPHEKVNHALVLGGAQGIGKDTILEPIRHAVGPWNFGDISPIELMGRFNAFLKSVVMRVSELRDLGDRDRFGFYEHTKTLIAAPPDTLFIDEKNIRAYRVPNLVGLIFTTNHRTDGLFLPADDRRHYVAWSDLTAGDFPDGYWPELYRWFEDDGEGGSGSGHVTAYLAARDLSQFDPKAPPPKTAAFWDVVSAGRAPEDADVADAIAKLNEPDALTVAELAKASTDLDFQAWLKDRKNSRQIPHRMEAAGYVATRNPDVKDGLWVVMGKRQVVYARRELSIRQRLEAARKLVERTW